MGLNRNLKSLSFVCMEEIKQKLAGIKQILMTAITKWKELGGKYWKRQGKKMPSQILRGQGTQDKRVH